MCVPLVPLSTPPCHNTHPTPNAHHTHLYTPIHPSRQHQALFRQVDGPLAAYLHFVVSRVSALSEEAQPQLLQRRVQASDYVCWYPHTPAVLLTHLSERT